MEWSEIQNEFNRVNKMSCKPVGLQKYKAGHIFDENMSVKWNRDKLEEENKRYQDEVARLNTAKNKDFLAANELVYQQIQDEVGHGLSRSSAKRIFEYVYEREHSYGIDSVFDELENMTDLLAEILDEQKSTRRKK